MGAQEFHRYVGVLPCGKCLSVTRISTPTRIRRSSRFKKAGEAGLPPLRSLFRCARLFRGLHKRIPNLSTFLVTMNVLTSRSTPAGTLQEQLRKQHSLAHTLNDACQDVALKRCQVAF
jgi:hypothetical protein